MPLRPGNRFVLVVAAAAFYAAVELLLVLALGRFLERERAEALLFLAWRPWLLVLAAALVAAWPWPRRLLFYALALLLAGLCEALLVLSLGAAPFGAAPLPNPWPEMLRGVAASAIPLVPADLIVQLGRRRWGKAGAAAAAGAVLLLLLVPAIRAPWDAFVRGPGDRAAAERKPRLLLMTSLPIVWGEYGPFDRRSRPSQTYRALREEFDIAPIDVADAPSLAKGRLLLLAQPRWLSPAELVALDGWVRGGGRALILADPALFWPSDLPLGDIRRPLPSSLLGPLLAHWRLELLPPHTPGPVALPVEETGRRIRLDSPGRFAGKGRDCVPRIPALYARCRVGAGRAILLADADLLRDDLWVAPGADGAARHRRLADNPLHLADLLDELAGLKRARVRAPVAWVHPEASAPRAILLAMIPLILLLSAAILAAWLRRFRPQAYPQDNKG